MLYIEREREMLQKLTFTKLRKSMLVFGLNYFITSPQNILYVINFKDDFWN